MSECPRFNHLLVLPHLRVQNANAISSPLTHGFPAITAFIGLLWALERKTRALGLTLECNAIGVVCHDYQEQVSSDYIKRFALSRNPIGRDGKTAAIVEEGRIHLEVSLILALYAEDWSQEVRKQNLKTIAELVAGMRVAGGSVLPAGQKHSRHRPWLVDLTGNDDDQLREFRKTCLRLLPGSALVSRDELIDECQQELSQGGAQADRLQAWLSLARLDWHYDPEAEEGKGAWQSSRRRGDGWIVPIPVGYGALGPLHPAGAVTGARDMQTPFRFVESLYSLGEWVGAHRLHTPQQLLWYADSNSEQGLYRCRNDYYSNTSLPLSC